MYVVMCIVYVCWAVIIFMISLLYFLYISVVNMSEVHYRPYTWILHNKFNQQTFKNKIWI